MQVTEIGTSFSRKLAALSESQVGTWERIPDKGVVRGDPTFAALFGVDAADAEEGLPISTFTVLVHPDDQAVFHRKRKAAESRGGLIVAEYRVRDLLGGWRWLLVRGRYRRLQHGELIPAGRGVVIDVTDNKLEMSGAETPFCLAEEDGEPGSLPLHRAADYVLGALKEIRRIEGQGRQMEAAAELLLHLIAKEMVRAEG